MVPTILGDSLYDAVGGHQAAYLNVTRCCHDNEPGQCQQANHMTLSCDHDIMTPFDNVMKILIKIAREQTI